MAADKCIGCEDPVCAKYQVLFEERYTRNDGKYYVDFDLCEKCHSALCWYYEGELPSAKGRTLEDADYESLTQMCREEYDSFLEYYAAGEDENP